MDKNTVIGLGLMLAIFFGYNWYSQTQQEEINKEKARIDSLALANAPKVEKELELSVDDFSKEKATEIEARKESQKINSYGEYLAKALDGSDSLYTIENDKMIVTLNSRGGSIASVELKDYTTFDNKPLLLFNKENSQFMMSLYLKRVITTSDFNFSVASKSDNAIALRLNVDAESYLEFAYNIAPESNMVDFKINMVGLGDKISPSQRSIDINWSNIAPQQEKGYKYESQYVTAAYKFPGEDSIEELGVKDTESETINSKVKWIAFKQQFFSSIFMAKNDFAMAEVGYKTLPENSGNIRQFVSNVTLDYSPTNTGYDFQFFFGPNNYKLMKGYDENFEDLIPMGSSIIGWINKLIVIPTFAFLSKYISNFGWIILLLTIFIKLIIFPFTYKSYLSMAKMRLLKPEMDEIANKYPKQEDAMKKQQATMELYRRAGVSPMGGCLPMLFQFPVLIAMFRFFPASIELRGEHFMWVNDLSSYDSICNLPFDIPFYGNHISLFALLMGISMFFSTKMNMANSGSQNNAQLPGMTFMTTYLMPVMLIVWFNSYSAALSYYYLLSNLITIGQTYIMRRFVDDEKLHQQMKNNAKKPKKKSKWQEKYDAMLKQQQETARQQQKQGKK